MKQKPRKGLNMARRRIKTVTLLRRGKMLDKYRIESRISNGPFAAVYRAYDTIEGIRVALKIPHPQMMADHFLDDFRKEVRLVAKIDHPHILHVKNASFIEDLFVIVMPLGEKTLAQRIQSRMSLRTTLDFAEQALDALSYAHSRRIIHCDIKPENFILFEDNFLRLADFGIAKMALRTMEASGSGTIGYIAPEQAMGRPSFKSDVFSMGLILYRMLSGCLPEWPFDWPPPGYEKIKRRIHPALIALMKRAIEVHPGRRFRDAGHMTSIFMLVKSRALAYSTKQRRRKKNNRSTLDWKEVRRQQFQRTYGKVLETRFKCKRCSGPVSEGMQFCPWCKTQRKTHRDETRYPARCPRCKRGIKLDWRYCPWCYGKGFKKVSNREYSDVRYQGRCSNSNCSRKSLMPFMRYCPWCRRSVQKKWNVAGSKARCPSCKLGVLPAYWNACPWCGKALKKL